MSTTSQLTRCWIAVVAVLGALFVQPAAAQQRGDVHIRAELVAEVQRPRANEPVTLAIVFTPEPGWHGYWSNPGDAGLGPRLDWTLPPGGTAGTPQFPVPTTLLGGGLMNHVYKGPHALLVPVTLPVSGAGPQPIRLKIDYLACTDKICVPQRAELSTMLDGRSDAVTPATRARFDAWRAKLPMPLGGTPQVQRVGETLRVAFPVAAGADLGALHVFPADKGMIVDAAPQRFVRDGDRVLAELAASPEGKPLAGLLALGDGRGLTFASMPGSVPALPVAGGAWLTIGLALGGAILGGLVLNVMPCVFPILSIKALSLAKAGGNESAARRDALGYTAGAIAVCMALGGAILALRAGGSSLGWAFQLQDPRVIVLLLLLSVVIALNLTGLFELPSVGGGLAGGNSFATGALAAFVATPCTGPFMGAALGAALVLPWPAALAVFGGLGLGLALPFLLLGFIPALRRRLPKPGPWMVTFRHWLAVPMFLTALALVWLLGRIAGTDAAAWGLGGALLIGLLLWVVGQRQARGLALDTALAVVLLATAGVAAFGLPRADPTAAVGSATLASEPFSEARLAALRAEGRPVFLYFTADWCLTCKVNERVAIEQPAVADAFAKRKVATLVGDWTRSDPAIGRFLAAQGRSGVPLYLYYAPGAEARVLPQVLTPGMLTALPS